MRNKKETTNINDKSFSLKRTPKGYELFLVCYIAIIIVPAIILSSGENAWVNIVLAAVLLVLVLYYYFDKTYDVSVSWGMKAIYTKAEQERYYMDFHRTHFWRETDVMLSYDVRNFIKDKIHELSVMARLGSKMRILMLDPRSKYVPMLEKASALKPGEYAYYVLQMQNFVMRNEQNVAESAIFDVTLKFYDDVPLDNMLRAYDVLFVYANKESAEGEATVYLYEDKQNGYNFNKILFDEKWEKTEFSYEMEITSDMVNNLQFFAENDTIEYKY